MVPSCRFLRISSPRSAPVVSYYLVRVELNDDPLEALGGAELYPGMQADVMIVTGAQTPLEYLVRPITTSLNRAMREN